MSSVYRRKQPLAEHEATSWRERERSSFDEQYTREGGHPTRADDDSTFRPTIAPPWEKGGTQGGLVQGEAYRLLTAHGLQDRDVLDYGCGLGKWAVHVALKGARVSGFDLSPVAIDYARERAELNGLAIRFDVADATRLPYDDAAFDIVLGVGVVHHVIKYPGTSEELHRVLRPGGIAVFTETLAENPLIELGRRFTMRGVEEAGDVGLTVSLIKDWAAPFAQAEVRPISMLLMAKRVIGFRPLLRALAAVDRRLLTLWPRLGRYGGECVVVLTK
jgi:2-polyprenyl-3-methyl-5-hydroxy-6-metoxy-1,4-benzoquinol methylase